MNQTYSQKGKAAETYGVLSVDIISIIISYLIALFIRFHSISGAHNKEEQFMTCAFFLFVCTVYSFMINQGNDLLKRGYFVEFLLLLKMHGVLLLAVGCLLFLTQMGFMISRPVVIYFIVVNLVLSFLLRSMLKKILRVYLKLEHSVVKILIVSEGKNLEEIVKSLKKNIDFNYEIVAIACMESGISIQECIEIPIIANRENLMETVKTIPFDEAFLHLPNEKKEKVAELIKDFESMGIICHYHIDVIDWNTKGSYVDTFGQYTVITYSMFSMDYRKRAVKRMIDILGAVIGILILLIVTPFTALAIKIGSKGPVFFSQMRIGKNGRRFKMYKFRSMYIDAEERKKELMKHNQIDGLMFKMDNDPRITKVGKFIRKTSIDELPQFINILKGDMSLIGTRPPTIDEFEQYDLYYRRRLSMTPGLTGLWQVSGRSEVQDFDDVVKYDLEYIDNWSLGLDFKILLQTIGVVLFGRGAK